MLAAALEDVAERLPLPVRVTAPALRVGAADEATAGATAGMQMRVEQFRQVPVRPAQAVGAFILLLHPGQ